MAVSEVGPATISAGIEDFNSTRPTPFPWRGDEVARPIAEAACGAVGAAKLGGMQRVGPI
jgi:hypothetical protein